MQPRSQRAGSHDCRARARRQPVLFHPDRWWGSCRLLCVWRKAFCPRSGHPEAKYIILTSSPQFRKSSSQPLKSPTSSEVTFVQNWNVFSLLKIKTCFNYATKKVSQLETVWALECQGTLSKVVPCSGRAFHSSLPSSPRISKWAQPPVCSAMGSRIPFKLRRPPHSKGDGGMCGLGLGTVTEMMAGRKLCSSGPGPFLPLFSPRPSQPAMGEPRDFTPDCRDCLAQDCWPRVYTNSLPSNKIQGVSHPDKLTAAAQFSLLTSKGASCF